MSEVVYKIKLTPKRDDGDCVECMYAEYGTWSEPNAFGHTYYRRDVTFESPQTAAAKLKDIFREEWRRNNFTGKIVRIGGEPVDWRAREQARFDNGTYDKLPWHDEPWYQAKHTQLFAHYSRKKSGMVSYTANAEKAEQDLQAPAMSPGRFLTEHFRDVLTAAEIEKWTATVDEDCGLNVLHITQDPDEIEQIYKNGPQSCMVFREDEYEGDCHPARVYAGPDLAVAYMGTLKDPRGRCVVWPEKKRYVRYYGDCSRMEMALEREGYEQWDDFSGARLRRFDCGHFFVLPYLDGEVQRAYDDGAYLVISRDGELDGSSTDGRSYTAEPEYAAYCDHCDSGVDEDELCTVYRGSDLDTQQWCSGCREYHTIVDVDGDYIWDQADYIELHGGRFDGEYAYDEGAAEIHNYVRVTAGDHEGEWWHVDDTAEVDGEIWHESDAPEQEPELELEAAVADEQ